MTDPQTPPVDVTEVDEPTAATAGEQDHSKPAKFRGADADAPADTGTPPQVA